MTTRIEEIAGWAAELGAGDIPVGIHELCRAQRRSVLGAVAGSMGDAATQRVISAVRGWAGPGPAPLLGPPQPGATQDTSLARGVRVDDALFAAAAASVALDFDDYVCFGHTGHSAVLVPLLLAAETGSDGAEQVTAQVIANEVAARLGGACLIGPQNGQLWSFIHTAAAALAAGRMLGLDAGRLAHALAISLYQPPLATAPGFFMPDSKLLTAAEPAVAGLRAARLAAQGVTGPLDALDHPQGFLSAFADVPLTGVLGGLGEGWATSTLCIKPYPGCAYIDTAVDALVQLGPPRLEDVASVEVDASALTCLMDALSRPYWSDEVLAAGNGVPTPVVVTFSVLWSLAVVLTGGRLTPDEVDPSWLSENRLALRDALGRITLRHDPAMSRRAALAFGAVLPVDLLARSVGVGGLIHAVSAAGRRQRGARGPGGRSLVREAGLLQGMASGGWRTLLDLAHDVGQRHRHGAARRWWDPEALEHFEMTFPARVRVRTRNGAELVAEVDVPCGGAGHPSVGPDAVAELKLERYGPRLWGPEGAAAIEGAIATDDDRLPALLDVVPGRPDGVDGRAAHLS